MRVERIDLAIVGAGPAGLSAALEARRLGVRSLVVLERDREAGGTPRHCGHLGFGMLDLARLWSGPRYAERLSWLTRDIDVRLAHTVTSLEPGGRLSVSTPSGPGEIEARRVLLATGIREMPRAARLVSGGRPFGILTTGALQRFVYQEGLLPCLRPVIVGTELVSYSAILTLRHAGTRPVALVCEERRSLVPQPAPALTRLLLGVPVRAGLRIVGIEGRTQVEGLTIEHSGRRETIDCDGVIFTGRWVPEATLMRLHPVGVDRETGGPVVDADLRTTDFSLFAAGNVRFGVRSSGRCALEGRRAGRIIAGELTRSVATGGRP